jgi:hypothetical protein
MTHFIQIEEVVDLILGGLALVIWIVRALR